MTLSLTSSPGVCFCPASLHAGNEGYGLRPLVRRCCTQLVRIEMAPADSAAAAGRQHQLVDSLNVSVATGILLHHMLTGARAGGGAGGN